MEEAASGASPLLMPAQEMRRPAFAGVRAKGARGAPRGEADVVVGDARGLGRLNDLGGKDASVFPKDVQEVQIGHLEASLWIVGRLASIMKDETLIAVRFVQKESHPDGDKDLMGYVTKGPLTRDEGHLSDLRRRLDRMGLAENGTKGEQRAPVTLAVVGSSEDSEGFRWDQMRKEEDARRIWREDTQERNRIRRAKEQPAGMEFTTPDLAGVVQETVQKGIMRVAQKRSRDRDLEHCGGGEVKVRMCLERLPWGAKPKKRTLEWRSQQEIEKRSKRVENEKGRRQEKRR